MLTQDKKADVPTQGDNPDRSKYAYVKTVKSDTYPYKVISRATKNQLAAFSEKQHAESFIDNVPFNVLLR